MGVIFFLLFLFLPSPLYAHGTLKELHEQRYRECVQEDNPDRCDEVIIYEELTPEQRDDVRRQLQRLRPDAISKKLKYLLEDGEGVPPFSCPVCIKGAETVHDSCVKHGNDFYCKSALLNDFLTSAQRREVREQLNRVAPSYVDKVVRYLSPSAVIVHTSPPAPTPPPPASPMAEAELGFQNFAGWVSAAFEVVFGLIALIVIFVLYLNFSRKSKERSAWANLPVEGPMKVNIQEQYVEAGSFNSKHVPCGLKIDVKISQNDWRVIANAGLMKKVLFHGDGPSGAQYDPENTRPWLGGHVLLLATRTPGIGALDGGAEIRSGFSC